MGGEVDGETRYELTTKGKRAVAAHAVECARCEDPLERAADVLCKPCWLLADERYRARFGKRIPRMPRWETRRTGKADGVRV